MRFRSARSGPELVQRSSANVTGSSSCVASSWMTLWRDVGRRNGSLRRVCDEFAEVDAGRVSVRAGSIMRLTSMWLEPHCSDHDLLDVVETVLGDDEELDAVTVVERRIDRRRHVGEDQMVLLLSTRFLAESRADDASTKPWATMLEKAKAEVKKVEAFIYICTLVRMTSCSGLRIHMNSRPCLRR